MCIREMRPNEECYESIRKLPVLLVHCKHEMLRNQKCYERTRKLPVVLVPCIYEMLSNQERSRAFELPHPARMTL